MPLLVGLIVLLVAEAMKGLLLLLALRKIETLLVVRMVAILVSTTMHDISAFVCTQNRHHPHY